MVTCAICGKQCHQITNTHLNLHGITTNQYKEEYPNYPTISKECSQFKSQVMMGKNKGNLRPDAQQRMTTNNPMKDSITCIKMGASRTKGISEGRIKILDNFGHLPTEKEKKLIQIFKNLNIPLEYVGNGKKWIENRCPDFINEERKIAVELDLDCFSHQEKQRKKEELYWRNGYKLIWLTSIDEEKVKGWLTPFFLGLTWSKIDSITKERNKNQRGEVCNIECVPNNNYFAEDILVHNCFANSFRSSLYVSFYDNSKDIGMRYCAPEYFRAELDKLMKYRGRKNNGTPLQRAIGMQIPIRFGIQFEDFLPIEGKKGISLDLLRYLADLDYPVMINTKSTLIGREDYLKALADNSGGSAVHITMISSNERLNRKLEPGAPSFKERIKTAKALIDAGIRVVARIEPLMVFINDREEDLQDWVGEVCGAGIRNVTFDSYSFSANNPKIKRALEVKGFDFERMFLLMSEVQWLGSLLLGSFMEGLRDHFSCSTFDFGNVPFNDQEVCCEVGDLYLEKGGGFSYGNTLTAIRFIKQSKSPVTWTMFDTYVEAMGGWLSDSIKMEVFKAWNLSDDPTINPAYFPDWAQGVETHGFDNKGHRVWKYDPNSDFRMEMLNSVIRKL